MKKISILTLLMNCKKLITEDKRNIILILLFITGILVRIILLGITPPGLNQDEASVGYESFSMLKYGIDRNGFHNPVHLVSWGSGQNALYSYLSMPLISLFGLNVFSIRLLNSIMGCLSLFLIYGIVKRLHNKDAGIVVLFFFVISPWHIILSRWGLESNLFPSLIIIAVYFLILSDERSYFLPVSFFVFSLSLYSYGTAYFFIPFFLTLITIYLIFHKKINKLNLMISIFIFVVFSLPIFLFVSINILKLDSIQNFLFSIPRLSGAPRFNSISSIFKNQILIASKNNFLNFFKLFFITQNDNLIWNSISEFGYLYLFSLPFFIFGFIKVFIRCINFKKYDLNIFFILWFLVCLLLVLVTDPNINRINIVFPVAIFFTGIGVYYLKEKAILFFRTILLLFSSFFVLFLMNYFFIYPKNIGPAFNESLDKAINCAVDHSNAGEKIFVTNRINMPYIFVLFYRKIDPNVFVKTVKYYNPGSEFQWVKSFDRYEFGEQNEEFNGNIYVFQNTEKLFLNNSKFNTVKFKNYSVAFRKGH